MSRVQRLAPYAYAAPALVLLGLFVYWPIVYSFVLSFQRWDFLSAARPFVGFGNYRTLYQSADFWNAIRATLIFVAASVPLRLALALALALAVRDGGRLSRGLVLVYYLPVVSSTVAVAITWIWLFQTDQGLINQALAIFALGPVPWLRNGNTALAAIVIVSVWKQFGYDVVVYLAGLSSIPKDYAEAASLDGAGRLTIFRRITWPLLMPTTFFLLVVAVIDSFQVFTLINIMTGGGPALATEMLIVLLYRLGFVHFEIGLASALAMVLFAGLILLTVLQFRMIGRRVHYAYG
jgi:multiple sugar transport system permease protein/sn-glycerol 3-phosphate transport system permease protein